MQDSNFTQEEINKMVDDLVLREDKKNVEEKPVPQKKSRSGQQSLGGKKLKRKGLSFPNHGKQTKKNNKLTRGMYSLGRNIRSK